MPILNWIGKDKVINHHLDVPYRILDKKYTHNATSSENKIIHGDNLEALKSLLPEYEGRINCIYIDPPYNTGNEGWVYNDNVNDPKIKKWLGEVVGKESEDLTRHDKWLCMMYPRLKLLHRLLAEDGAIFISIDDNEQANLKLICDEIFGAQNYIGTLIQNKMNAKNDTINIQRNHEFIIVYRKRVNTSNTKTLPTLVYKNYRIRDIIQEGERFYYLNDAITTRGDGGTLKARPNLGYTIYYNPKTNDKIAVSDYNKDLALTSNDINSVYSTDKNLIKEGYIPVRPPKVRGNLGCWTWDINKFENEKDNIVITGKKTSLTARKRTFVDNKYVYTENKKLKYKSQYAGNTKSILDFSTNEGTSLLNSIMKKARVFENPKNLDLITYLINLIPHKNSIILDSFAGSGTTAHAVLNLNKKDGGNRKFILIEMEDYANDITAERVKRVIAGYGDDKNAVEGTEGDFSFYELGQPLFLENEYLNEELPLIEIHRYIWYTETASKFDEQKKEHKHLLGIYDNSSYYFFYEKDSLTTLSYEFLDTIKHKSEAYVIYADNCVLPKEFMAKQNIIFKKIPRDITRF